MKTAQLKRNKMKMRGYVALTVVIILIPVLVMGGVDLLYSNIDILHSAKQLSDSEKLNFNLRSCTEEGIRKIKLNPSITGIQNFTIDGYSCTVNITNDTNPSIKIINTQTSFNNLYRTEVKKLNTTTSPFELSN